ncbi:MAG: hypothetical protein FRX49_02389 [Trebouxia sp. A1-2]|nr:MAG: hypothetical protein FRX49_02389 [Trebouxia sp. A1-2]
MHIHAPLSIKDMAVRLEDPWDLPVLKVKQGQLVLGAPVLSVQEAQHVYTLDETDILFGENGSPLKRCRGRRIRKRARERGN